jgi:ABC-type glycerol-3-phosphate transport system substrate-binding protein
MRHKRFSVCGMALVAAGVLAGSGSASAPSSATCIGQFFSSHAGSGAEGVTVGSFVSETAQELGKDFGQTIAGGRELPRDDCGF